MSFWNDPGASFQGLMDDPWHSLENFGTTGLVPLIPYVGGIVGGIYGGPAGARAGGAAGQAGVDYFSGNSDARTGEGIFGSLFSGAGKGGIAYGGYDSLGNGGFENLGNLFNMGGENAFQQLPSDAPISEYTPEYLNNLAEYQGVDAGDVSYLDRLLGNTEQGLYKQEGLAQQASGQTVTDLLKKQAQQKAMSQLGQSGSNIQQQGQQQQAEQNRMAQQQAMMSRGQPVDVTTALLSLLQDRQQSKQPRISLI
jgi:hypothetical protein